MVYNRCVGTRYCSNNCPYKVRRFNFFEYADFETPSLKPLRNPDVTVRSRGVMEKCTYCVQRINVAQDRGGKGKPSGARRRNRHRLSSRLSGAGDFFGDINDRDSRVAKVKADSLNYGLLTELNTKPRTTYLAKLKNPNPEIKIGLTMESEQLNKSPDDQGRAGPVIEPGHTFASVTDKISAIVLTAEDAAVLVRRLRHLVHVADGAALFHRRRADDRRRSLWHQ